MKKQSEQASSVLIGTYTTNTDSKGIYRVRFPDGVAGKAEVKDVLVTGGAKDPSYLLSEEDGFFWVEENLGESSGNLVSAVKKGAGYEVVKRCSTQGENPCHLAVSPDRKWLAAANYTSGSVALYWMENLTEEEMILFPGKDGSVNPIRQEGPHAHFVIFPSEKELWCCDLGGDLLRKFLFENGQWNEAGPLLSFPKGVGPRHLVKEGNLIYVLCELSSELFVYDLADGSCLCRMNPFQEEPDLDAWTAAAIKRSEEGCLYVTQRGSNRVEILSLEDPKHPEWVAGVDCGGDGPRDLLLIPGGFLCTCQNSNTVSVFSVTSASGAKTVKLEQTLSIPAPVCAILEK